MISAKCPSCENRESRLIVVAHRNKKDHYAFVTECNKCHTFALINFAITGVEVVDRPDCHSCEYRAEAPGTCHIQCKHPAISIIDVARPNGANPIGVVSHPHGIKNGWCNWPIQFDPTWIIACNGFKAKENSNASVPTPPEDQAAS